MEKDLGTKLDWVAVDHVNTGHPHSHVVVRGKDEFGKDLIIAQDYLTEGLRHRAQDLATLELGPQTQQEIARRREAEVSAERFTDLDHGLMADMTPERTVNVRPAAGQVRAETDMTLRQGRLNTLERMGLVEQISPGVWRLSEDLGPTLRAVSERGDIIRAMSRAVSRRGREASPETFVIDPTGETSAPKVGGMIHVVKADGTTFPSTEKNVGVETQLYTRYDLMGAKDLTIEKWFSTEIESPFVEALNVLAELNGLRRFRVSRGDPNQAAEVKALGFVVDDWHEQLDLTPKHRTAITNYIAAMLVRSPRYIAKLIDFHADSVPDLDDAVADKARKTVALENMLWLYELYRDRIASAHLALLRVDCDRDCSSQMAALPPKSLGAPVLCRSISMRLSPLSSASTCFHCPAKAQGRSMSRGRASLVLLDTTASSWATPSASFTAARPRR